MRILVVEDEASLADLICESLIKENYIADVALDGEEGLFRIRDGIYDLVILDVMLPKMDGFSVLKAAREEGSKVPVLMLTAKAEVDDKVFGLDAGADDYMTKPFAMKELLARVRARIRTGEKTEYNELAFGDVKLDKNTSALYSMESGQNITLGSKEYLLMEYLLHNGKQIVSKEQISNKIWGCESNVEYNNVEVYVSFLRKKLSFLESKVTIKTIRGSGYCLREEN